MNAAHDKPARALTLAEGIRLYLEARPGKADYPYQSRWWVRFFGAQTPLSQIGPRALAAFARCRCGNVTAHAAASYVSTLMAFIKWCRREGYVGEVSEPKKPRLVPHALQAARRVLRRHKSAASLYKLGVPAEAILSMSGEVDLDPWAWREAMRTAPLREARRAAPALTGEAREALERLEKHTEDLEAELQARYDKAARRLERLEARIQRQQARAAQLRGQTARPDRRVMLGNLRRAARA